MNRPDVAAALPPDLAIPRAENGAVFPAPWAARAFALAVSLNECGLFRWSEWAGLLGAELGRARPAHAADPDQYWRAWLSALESMMERKGLGSARDLEGLQEAWRRAAEATPHGQAVELRARSQA